MAAGRKTVTPPTPRQQLDAFIDRYNDDVAAVARSALRHLERRVPGATQSVYDNYNALGIGFGPGDKASEVVLSIVLYPRWVSLFFLQGAGLRDPKKRLQGQGTRVRHIVLDAADIIGSADVEALIGLALQSAKVAIDPARKGTLLIKSVSARQRQRPRRPVAKSQKTMARRTSRKAGVDYATVRELALALPDVVDSSTLRGIAFEARGRLLACKAVHRSAEPETLMVRVGEAHRDRWIAAEPEVYYLTPHYLVNASVLVRLKRIRRKALESVLEAAWQFVTAAAP
jgi:hypothetical protein